MTVVNKSQQPPANLEVIEWWQSCQTSSSKVGSVVLPIRQYYQKGKRTVCCYCFKCMCVIDSYAVSMTKDIVVGDELPDWVGAKEFYQKYDPKEVIGRWVQQKSVTSDFLWDDKNNNVLSYVNPSSGVWAAWCAGVCTDTQVRSWRWRLLRSQLRRWPLSSWRRSRPQHLRRSKSSTWWRDMPQSVRLTSALFCLVFFSWRFKVLTPCHVLFPAVTLIDSYESTTFIFLVFDLWVIQQSAV